MALRKFTSEEIRADVIRMTLFFLILVSVVSVSIYYVASRTYLLAADTYAGGYIGVLHENESLVRVEGQNRTVLQGPNRTKRVVVSADGTRYAAFGQEHAGFYSEHGYVEVEHGWYPHWYYLGGMFISPSGEYVLLVDRPSSGANTHEVGASFLYRIDGTLVWRKSLSFSRILALTDEGNVVLYRRDGTEPESIYPVSILTASGDERAGPVINGWPPAMGHVSVADNQFVVAYNRSLDGKLHGVVEIYEAMTLALLGSFELAQPLVAAAMLADNSLLTVSWWHESNNVWLTTQKRALTGAVVWEQDIKYQNVRAGETPAPTADPLEYLAVSPTGECFGIIVRGTTPSVRVFSHHGNELYLKGFTSQVKLADDGGIWLGERYYRPR